METIKKLAVRCAEGVFYGFLFGLAASIGFLLVVCK